MEKFVPKKDEKDVISLRISLSLLEIIDRKAAAIDISRNQFVIQCIEYALANMDDEPPKTYTTAPRGRPFCCPAQKALPARRARVQARLFSCLGCERLTAFAARRSARRRSGPHGRRPAGGGSVPD